jgi:3-hydroxyisobutyrate dehydrogenase-like beta-hydroxyacid dehydrogenase
VKVAFIGIGKMGLPMAGNVLRAGHDLTVFNRTTSRCDPLRDDGATVATSAAEAVREAEVLVTMVAAGALASPFVDYKKAAFLDPDGTPPAFALDLMRKDLTLALELGEAAGLPLLGAGAAAEAVTIAAGLEGGDEDLVRVADALRRIARGAGGDAKN